MIIIILAYGINNNMLDGELKGYVLILETGKLLYRGFIINLELWQIYGKMNYASDFL